MTATRCHTHSETFACTPERLFKILHTPSAVRIWWQASRVIIIPEAGGLWAAAWGADEDDPDYVSAATIARFDPPTRLRLEDMRYCARQGALPFEADFSTEFSVEAEARGARLTVVQDGFPAGAVADDFYRGCRQGWRDTFAGIRRFVEST